MWNELTWGEKPKFNTKQKYTGFSQDTYTMATNVYFIRVEVILKSFLFRGRVKEREREREREREFIQMLTKK